MDSIPISTVAGKKIRQALSEKTENLTICRQFHVTGISLSISGQAQFSLLLQTVKIKIGLQKAHYCIINLTFLR